MVAGGQPAPLGRTTALAAVGTAAAQMAARQLSGRGFPLPAPARSRTLRGLAARAAGAAGAASAPPAPAGEAGAGAATERRKRVLSGVQPTGTLHLGNYFGAIKNWVKMQDEYDTFIFLADLHAITVPHDPVDLRASTRSTAALYLASGIDQAKATIFVQSQVAAHSELAWLLQCATPMGWLERMIQFKEKAKRQGQDVGCGLLSYPVLMAADILLYQADVVPVGEDQKQHLELTRDIAGRVNSLYGGRPWKRRGGRGGKVLKIPEPFIPEVGARIMSLQDGTAKMSKSAESDLSRINMLDPPELIEKKIKRAKTDTFDTIALGDPARAEANNLLGIYQIVTGYDEASVAAECTGLRWGDFKPKLAEAVVEHMRPIQADYATITEDPANLDRILADGAAEARAVADQTVARVRDAMGYYVAE